MRILALISILALSPAFPQTSADHSSAQTSDASNKKRKRQKGSAAEVGSGVGTIAAGAGKGKGDAASGVAHGAVDLATLHPLDAGVAVGTGAVKTGKDVGVGTAKGAGKVGKGVGHALRKIF